MLSKQHALEATLSKTKTVLFAIVFCCLGLGAYSSTQSGGTCYDCGSVDNCLNGSGGQAGYEWCGVDSDGNCYVSGYTEDCSGVVGEE